MLATSTVGPRGAAADAAREIAERHYSPALLHHCVRSFLFAAEYGRRTELAFDEEMLFVAAMLHDIALAPTLDSYSAGFDDASAEIAWILAVGLRWPVERRTRLVAAVLAHMLDDVDMGADPEGYLLERSTSWDISGQHQQDLATGFVTELLGDWPRVGIAEEFLACFHDQATRKPQSSAARAMGNGIAERILGNPLDRPPVGRLEADQ